VTLAETHSLRAAGRSMRSRIESILATRQGEPFLPLPEFDVDLTRGRRGRLLRRLAPGVVAMLEHELELLWAANEQRRFDLDAATRGTMLSTQAATLATLRRLERGAGDRPGGAATAPPLKPLD
jgi:hypothetical protein